MYSKEEREEMLRWWQEDATIFWKWYRLEWWDAFRYNAVPLTFGAIVAAFILWQGDWRKENVPLLSVITPVMAIGFSFTFWVSACILVKMGLKGLFSPVALFTEENIEGHYCPKKLLSPCPSKQG